ncbi:FemAB family XrtA/PEP-CTERM system-associated protein [Reinekea sp.]|jgi:FemAB-related protein (PEP-CTERM system-associated)|uniref:FemAB family XrtA/PEP-CTERM system-associated protein n=1 Tax=Reinekea sp. TaxID=1970455 RepID=UPI003989135B
MPTQANLKSQIKALKKTKGAISSQFKTAKENPSLLAQLKTQMQAISSQIAELETQYKAQISNPNSSTDVENNAPCFPSQFTAPEQDLNAPFIIETLTQEQWPRWQHFCQQALATSLCHETTLYAAIEQAFGHKTDILVAICDGEIVGGLPLTKLSSRLFGTFLVSTPYFNYGGPLTSYVNVFEALIKHSKQLLDGHKASHAEVRTTVANIDLPFADKKASMILALPKTAEELDAKVGSKVRAQVNKANEHNPSVAFGHHDLLDDFYKVFARNMRDLGTPVYSKQWFATLLDQLQYNATIIVAYVNNKPVGTAFLTGHRDMLEVPWASTIKSANAMNINMWMYRQILGFAIKKGFMYFDFGRSTIDAGTYKFKKQWGAQPVAHYWYYASKNGNDIAQTNPDNPKFKLLIAIWKRLPIWFANLIGPRVIKNIP